MERPDKVYLEEPVTIHGITVKHTRKGLIYMIDHYKTVLALPLNSQQLKDEDRKYIQQIIDNYNVHLQLYERENAAPAETPIHN